MGVTNSIIVDTDCWVNSWETDVGFTAGRCNRIERKWVGCRPKSVIYFSTVPKYTRITTVIVENIIGIVRVYVCNMLDAMTCELCYWVTWNFNTNAAYNKDMGMYVAVNGKIQLIWTNDMNDTYIKIQLINRRKTKRSFKRILCINWLTNSWKKYNYSSNPWNRQKYCQIKERLLFRWIINPIWRDLNKKIKLKNKTSMGEYANHCNTERLCSTLRRTSVM